MTKDMGIGSKRIMPVPTTAFERDLVFAIESALKEIENSLKDLETRVVALEP